jgi:hypothetical protein
VKLTDVIRTFTVIAFMILGLFSVWLAGGAPGTRPW